MRMVNEKQRLQLLGRIDRILGSSFNLSKVIRMIYKEISKVMDTSNFYIAIYNPKNNTIKFEIYTIEGKAIEPFSRPLSGGLTEYVIKTKKPLLINKDLQKQCKKIGIVPIGKNAYSWLGVPMIYKGNVEGVMTVQDYKKENAYDWEDELFLTNIASKAAVVIANTRLVEEEMRRAKELAMLNKIVHRLTRSLNLNEICESVTESILEYFKKFNVAIFWKEGDSLVLKKLSRGFKDEVPRDLRMQFGQGIVGSSAQAEEVVIVNDVSADKRYISFGQTSTKSEVAIPLKIGKKLCGILDIQCNEPNAFDPDTVRVLELIADRLSVAFHNAKLYEEAVARSRELSVSFTIAQSLISTLELDDVLNRILDVIRTNFGYENCAILLVDKKSNELYVRASSGYPEYVSKHIRLNISKKEGIPSYVAATGKPYYAPDVSKTPFYVMGKKTIKSEAAVPLIVRESVIGVLDIESEKLNAFTEQDIRMFTVFASQAAIAIENARLYNETKEMSLTDSLTRIANRRHFDLILENELKRGRGYARYVSLAMIDLDHFKDFNDRFGHQAGDQLLISIASKLKSTVRDTDLVARYGGEEFVIIFPETPNNAAIRVCERIRTAIENNYINLNKFGKIGTTVSIGLATYPQSAQNAQELIHKADLALYRAKKLGRNRVETIS
uniref:Diguanylate cyclase n=1 Tax=candidate division WOR-3 bacterium TaxID=2052148 RepID=A0A7V1EHA2_UNCW3